MTYFPMHDYFVTCASGLEPILADELRALRCRSVRPQGRGVQFKGTVKDGYRVCLWSRFGSRVLLELAIVDARNTDYFYRDVHAIPWEEHIHPTGTLAIDSVGENEEFRNNQFVNVRTKDAIVDRLRRLTGTRPNVDTESPDVRINVAIHDQVAKISLDLSGQPLHRRYYRSEGVQVAAPLKETLAAALLHWGGWPAAAAEGRPLVDFMCGSGTIPIEAAMMAGDIAPGIFRKRWGFTYWLGHDETAWYNLFDEVKRRRAKGADKIPPIMAGDSDSRSVDVARQAIRRAQLDDVITLKTTDLANVRPAAAWQEGLIAFNPPYGKRLMEEETLSPLYEKMSSALAENWQGYKIVTISSNEEIAHELGVRQYASHATRNGAIDVFVSIGEVPKGD